MSTIPNPDELWNAKISFFDGATRPKVAGTLTVADTLERIRAGTHREAVETKRRILASRGQEAYIKAKQHLPAVTFGGTFSYRANDKLLTHSGIVHGDIDKLQDVLATKTLLIEDPYTAYCFISPSGAGLKLGVRVEIVSDDAHYKIAWQQVADYFSTTYQITWDIGGKDIARLCFLSWDADLYRNHDVPLFPIDWHHSANPPKPPPKTTTYSRADMDTYAERAIKTAVDMIDRSILGNRHPSRRNAARLLG